MEPKKYPSADLEKWRGLWFNAALVLSLSTVIMAFEWEFEAEPSLIDLGCVTEELEEILEIPATRQPPPPPPKMKQPRIIEVENEEEIEEEVQLDLDIEAEQDEVISDLVLDPGPEPEDEVADEIFTIVQVNPEFKGGMTAFYRFLQANMMYPSVARQMEIEGKVFVSIVVEKDGRLSNIQVAKGIGAGCDQEALRVIRMSPIWNPGLQRGRPVRARLMVPLFFQLN